MLFKKRPKNKCRNNCYNKLYIKTDVLKIKKLFPVNHNNRKNSGKLYYHFKHICKRSRSDAYQWVGKLHVGGAGNRQKFGDTLNDSDDDSLDNAHCVFYWFCSK